MAMAGQMIIGTESILKRREENATPSFISIPTASNQSSTGHEMSSFEAENFEREQEAEDFFFGSPKKKR